MKFSPKIYYNGNLIEIIAEDNTKLPLSGGTLTGTINSQNVVPKSNNVYSLGSSSYYWTDAYINKLYANFSKVNDTLQVQFPNFSTLISAGYLRSDYADVGYPEEDFCKAICRWAINTYPNNGNIMLIGVISPNSTGNCFLNLYSSSGKDSSNNPRYASGIYNELSGSIKTFGFNNYSWYWSTVAKTSQLANYLPLSGGTVYNSDTDSPLVIKSNSGASYIQFKNSSGDTIGYLGVNSSNQPVFYDTSNHRLAYYSDLDSYLPLTGGTIMSAATDLPLEIQASDAQSTFSGVAFLNHGGTIYGAIGANSNQKPVFTTDGSTLYEMALVKDAVKYAGNQTGIGSGSPASGAKNWVNATNLPNGNSLVYNSSGDDYTLLYSFKPNNLNHGTILRWGCEESYLRILRYSGTGWQSNDWEKISAGYADSAGNAARADNAGYTWNGLITIGTWSRVCKLNLSSYTGGSCLFTIKGTRNSVVYQGTFLIQTNHWSSDTVSILCLSSSNYTSIKLRAISDGQGQNCYIEVLDNASGSGTQTVNCTVLPLTKEANTPDLYTTYQAGEIPSGYYSEEIVFGGSHGLSTSRRIKAGTSLIGSGGTGSGDSSANAILEADGGIIKIKNYGIIFEIGARNSAYIHFENNSTKPYYFDNTIYLDGSLYPYANNSKNLGNSSYQFNNIYGKTIYEDGTSLANKYLQLTGGTIKNANNEAPLEIDAGSAQSVQVGISYCNSSGTLWGIIGVNSSKKPVFSTNGENFNEIALSSDLNSYLPLSGGTTSGTTILNNNYAFHYHSKDSDTRATDRWYNIGTLSPSFGYINCELRITGGYNYQEPSSLTVNISTVHQTCKITQISGYTSRVLAVRCVLTDTNKYKLEVKLKAVTSGTDGANYFSISGICGFTAVGEYDDSTYSSSDVTELTVRTIPTSSVATMADLNSYLPTSGGTLSGTLNSRSIIPAVDDSYNLGASNYSYNAIYGTTIYEDGTALSSKYLPFTGGEIKSAASDMPLVIDASDAQSSYVGIIYCRSDGTPWGSIGVNSAGDPVITYDGDNCLVLAGANTEWHYLPAIGSIIYDPHTCELKRTDNGYSWNKGTLSKLGYKTCSVTFKAGKTSDCYIMIGLSTDTDTSHISHEYINYAVYLYCGQVHIYESGTPMGSFGTYSIGDECSVEYSNGYISYYHNGTRIRRVSRAYGSSFYARSSFYASGNVYSVKFSPIPQALNKIYAWALESSKPKYSASEVGALPTTGGTIYGSSDSPLVIKSNTSSAAYIQYKNSSGTSLGFIGVNSLNKPVFYDTSNKRILLQNEDNKVYTNVAYYYRAGNTTPYVAFTFESGSWTWAMISMEFTVRLGYSAKTYGKMYVTGYVWKENGTWRTWDAFEVKLDSSISSLKVYSKGLSIYITDSSNSNVIPAWTEISLDKMMLGDNVTDYGTYISVSAESSLPSGTNEASYKIYLDSSGNNLKTVNGQSLVGSGNIEGGTTMTFAGYLYFDDDASPDTWFSIPGGGFVDGFYIVRPIDYYRNGTLIQNASYWQGTVATLSQGHGGFSMCKTFSAADACFVAFNYTASTVSLVNGSTGADYGAFIIYHVTGMNEP